LIRLEKLRKEFDDVVAVDDVDLEVPAGEIFGLIGPNGAGKTTTIRMACGLLTPTSGRVFIAGTDPHREPERAQGDIGYLSDSFALYEDLRVREYLDYFAHAYRMPAADIARRIDEVLSVVGLDVKREGLIAGLSRGMKQRLGLARAFIHRPRVLLLDEPASGLDPKARLDLRNLLRQLRDGGTTVLISSHILSELEGFCTSIGLMEHGRMTRSGRLEAIAIAEDASRAIHLRWIGPHEGTVSQVLGSASGVSGVMVGGVEGAFRHTGSDEHLASLLAALVARGVTVVAFGEVKETIEDVYMRLSRHEVT
jgi:ABC-2 type transport system ATP-binding protein